ncbi:hypothetical protein HS048_33845 [Planomonospora sp. ID91781]|uniref:hypothetical protein n=1 Tax=Planomonospora sp. ID91781 TaxID=2738135 RepID=UPI0018C39191|nr:hypothetical protein [Planomonospora sp. ID91781]MBG0825670.1 hypothetical protein [Planomonospora sp. ID91781]
MTRPHRTAAVSAVLVSLGLTGVIVTAAASLAGAGQASAAARTVLAEPTQIPGCDVDPAAECQDQPEVPEEPAPVVTVTVTANPDGTAPKPSASTPGQVTVTATVTAPPKKPSKTAAATTTTAAPPPAPTQTAQQTVQPPPSNPVEPPVTSTPEIEETEPQFPTAEPSPAETLPTASPEPSTSTFAEPDPATVPYEIRNATSGSSPAALSQQLGIPALILVLLVLFGVLIFEGRLRRLAHAAAVRRAGPRGYPAGPGYASAPGLPYGSHQGGTAYAPIISFVPMQMYPQVHPEAYPAGQPYDPATAHMPPPGFEQYPYGAFEQHHHGPSEQHPHPFEHGPFEQGPHGPETPGPMFREQTPPTGPEFYGESHGGPLAQESGSFPGGPGLDGPLSADPTAPTAPGPIQQGPLQQGPFQQGLSQPGPLPPYGDPFPRDPALPDPPSQDRFPQDRFPQDPALQGGDRFPQDPPPSEDRSPGGTGGDPSPPTGPAATAVYPLPGQETKRKRGLFRRGPK